MRLDLRRLPAFAAAALAALLAIDASRPADAQWSARIAVGGVHLYQRMLSPPIAALGVRCRFAPSCSQYAEVAIRERGIVAGSWRATRRLARCNPWTPLGTQDPP